MSEENKQRRDDAKRIRDAATTKAYERANDDSHKCVLKPGAVHTNNGEEFKYAQDGAFMSFSKGLAHDPVNGLPEAGAVKSLRGAIDSGLVQSFDDIGIGDRDKDDVLKWRYFDFKNTPPGEQHRRWEAPTAGFVFDLQGPDAQAVTMPAAPSLEANGPDTGDELAAEMAEVYWLALIRDVPFNAFSELATTQNPLLDKAIASLQSMPFYSSGGNSIRTRPQHLSKQNVFRGQTEGEDVGPYLSQFLLLGNSHLGNYHQVTQGQLQYGSLRIDQRVRTAKPYRDYMTHWDEWLDVQHGANVVERMCYETAPEKAFRFIATPRDLATYVHFDALYEAYLNACLWLLNVNAPRDPNFAKTLAKTATTEGFALFGGPHVLTLVTEVATRALKAVRYQKFNNHLRARPEVVAARIAASEYGYLANTVEAAVEPLRAALSESGTLKEVKEHNRNQNQDEIRQAHIASHAEGMASKDNPALLPMAFAEGSPMHPAYGAGHATVAGACVTMLKAFFDESAILVTDSEGNHTALTESQIDSSPIAWTPISYVPTGNGSDIDASGDNTPLTVGHELNKLAANISIGRNMGGVHYYSDYIESMRMGEAIAVGILEEQLLTYEKIDEFVVSFKTFDVKDCVIKRKGEEVSVKFA